MNGTNLLLADSMLAVNQWETVLLCKDISHWLGASMELALRYKHYNSKQNKAS